MAELNPPWALENLATHHANVARMLTAALAGRGEGVVGGGDLLVAQRGAGANMSVDVAAGSAIAFGDENAQQGAYGALVNDATKNLVISAADPTNPRRDLVVAKVQDAFYSGATNAWSLAVVVGTAAGSPVDPAMPNNGPALARVAVVAAAASIVNANITDLRPFMPSGIAPVNSARRHGTLYGPYSQEAAAGFRPAPYKGLMAYETDNDRLLYYTGAAWQYYGAVVPHVQAINRVVAANPMTFTNPTTATVMSDPTERTALTMSFTKYRTDTGLILFISCEVNNSSGAAQGVNLYLTINGVNYIVARTNFAAASDRRQIVGTYSIAASVVPAGSYSVEPKISSDIAMIPQIGQNYVFSYSITETL